MKNKKTRSRAIVALCLIIIVSLVFASKSVIVNAEEPEEQQQIALSEDDILILEQNGFYRAVYSNLKKCFVNMQETIDENIYTSNASYNSDVFYQPGALDDEFLVFPYSLTYKGSDAYNSSCPHLVLGWKESFIANIFSGDTPEGSSRGLLSINGSAQVPVDHFSSNENSAQLLHDYLMAIGYEKIESTEGTLAAGMKCFYLKATIGGQEETARFGGIEPSTYPPNYTENGNKWVFESQDFCVRVDNDDHLLSYSDSLISLYGLTKHESAYDQREETGHRKGLENAVNLIFNDGDSEPIWLGYGSDGGDLANTLYLPSELTSVVLLWPHGSYDIANDWGKMLIENKLSSRDDIFNSSGLWPWISWDRTPKSSEAYKKYCTDRGYVSCFLNNGDSLISSLTAIPNYDDNSNKAEFGSNTYNNQYELITFDVFKTRMTTLLAEMIDDGLIDGDYHTFGSVSAELSNPVKRYYSNDLEDDSKYIYFFLLNTSEYDYGAFPDDEKYILYWDYLKDYYNIQTTDNEVSNSYLVTWLQEDGTFAKQYIYAPGKNVDKKKPIPNKATSKWDNGGTMATWEEIAILMQNINVPTAFEIPPTSIVDPALDLTQFGPGSENAYKSEPSCTTNAGELGWLLCPILKGAAKLMKEFFENWIEPFLKIDADILRVDSGGGRQGEELNGVFQAWQTFQGIANLAFACVFIFVIFSQLTGVGIDNYGIKKVLPKLIVGAIMINMSYIICQLAVDISNIVGGAMKDFLLSLPPTSGQIGEIHTNINGVAAFSVRAGTIILVGIIGVIGYQQIQSMGLSVIIPILFAVLGLVFGLLFLFFMLGLRQALAIILVAVSPVAFVCYIIPNTKSLFRRWVDMFKALLLAYPICAGMVYGGDLVSRILLTANAASERSGNIKSLGVLITAALVSIMPVFFIPGLIKKAISAVNGLGGLVDKMQSRGKNGLKTARKATENMGFNKRYQERHQRDRAAEEKTRAQKRDMRRAGLKYNSETKDYEFTKRGRRLNAQAESMKNDNSRKAQAFRAKLANDRNAAIAGINEDMANARIGTEGGAKASLAGLNAKQEQQAVADEITNMAKETGYYDTNKMQKNLENLMNKENRSSDEEMRMKALATKMSETGDGAKALARTLGGDAGNGETRKELAEYMVSSGASYKLGNKDMNVAKYVQDIAANNVSSDTSYDSWRGMRLEGRKGKTNEEFVAQDILDDDQLLARQSGDSLRATIANGGMTKERAQRMIDNQNLGLKDDQIKELQRYIAIS